ncbi:pyridoxamine 5'-phosphate oxidase family protein [Kribbella antibiotica]|uniref:Pyridoxamine 5'-phosphate oxidase family protein n=1 Tax=Kribbella antibiotica TaxID=190195 RepID=A0A4R4YFW5_9ACTN|nr:pyridoxamine 5'-phosphate oxidase family protein [Kribbella antibiotica]TDD43685.1 pyridoxamine 5'-phosphate oxidase family protein [Kribbella antibiotica]
MVESGVPRALAVRRRDCLRRLEDDVDAWVATASPEGTPYLMPLSFLWNGECLFLSTAASNPTARNLRANPAVQLTLGELRDVVHISGVADAGQPTAAEAQAFADKAGFDPRPLANYPFIRITPTKVQAWREVGEIAGRLLMRDGVWLA